MKRITRRALLAGSAAAALGAAIPFARPFLRRRRIEGRIVGASAERGHRLREGGFPSPSAVLEVPVAIFGGGIAGLGAAWWLDRCGCEDFRLFELEDSAGGNARSDRNEVTPYPWGAHYVPVPGATSGAVRDLFRDLGVITGTDPAGAPVYDQRYLCFEPRERLFLDGRWEEGLFPERGATDRDRAQMREFHAWIETLRREGGFSLPVESCAADPRLRSLDGGSMDELLRARGWDSPRLRWFVEYACRDDYGCSLATTSAWAGAHYFAARTGPEAEHETPLLTWPEGNGWIVQRLVERCRQRLAPGWVVTRLVPERDRVIAEVFEVARGRTVEVRCRHAICALPRFVAAAVVEPYRASPPAWMRAFTYAPWMVANLTVDRVPAGVGFPPAWDNVLYDSDSLGYVVATHQSVATAPGPSVLTYYRPFVGTEPAAERLAMARRTWTDWRDEILADLAQAHPDLADGVRRLDVMLWGHAMIRPVPKFVWGPDRPPASESLGNLHFAHSDLGGLPLFEEALHWGVKAARLVIERMG